MAQLLPELGTPVALYRAITLYQSWILDGRARGCACREAQVEPESSEFAGSDEDAVSFVASENLTARQLKLGQHASCAARLRRASNQARKSAKLQKMTQEFFSQ